MPHVKYWQVDAFTDRPFQGNPAAVCWLEKEATEEWMQSVASEMNLSETAFVLRTPAGLNLRWFTPTTEVDLCGHATLATAHALWVNNLAPREEPLLFHTRSGLLTCHLHDNIIELDFPALPATAVPPVPEVLQALGLSVCEGFGRNRFDILVEVAQADLVRQMQPDFSRLKQVYARGVIVTAPSDDPAYDFISRFFAPSVGVDEDPVCGSAHCCLATYWGEKLKKRSLIAFQASRRTGILRLTWKNDRVLLGGKAVIVSEGEILAT